MLTRRIAPPGPRWAAVSLALSVALPVALTATSVAVLGGVAGAATATATVTVTATSAHPAPTRFAVSDSHRLLKEMLAAWQITKGQGVTVALVGSGIDASATGLGARLRVGPHFGSPQPRSNGYATALAMDIAGAGPSTQDPLQSEGLAPQVRVLVDEVHYGAPDGTWQQQEASALDYAVGHGASVVYLDSVGPDDGLPLDQAVANAQAKGAVVVVGQFETARGTDSYKYPAALPGVLIAGAVDLPGLIPPVARHLYRPYDQSVLVAAPANTRLLDGPSGPDYLAGAPGASMWLVAVAALIKSVYPHLSPALVQQALALSANDHPPGGYNTTVGFGLINPEGALHEAATLGSLGLAASNGPGVAGPAARLASGPPPGVVTAVHHSALRLAGFGGLALLGLALLALAAILARRRRQPSSAPPDVWHGVVPYTYGKDHGLPPGGAQAAPRAGL